MLRCVGETDCERRRFGRKFLHAQAFANFELIPGAKTQRQCMPPSPTVSHVGTTERRGVSCKRTMRLACGVLMPRFGLLMLPLLV